MLVLVGTGIILGVLLDAHARAPETFGLTGLGSPLGSAHWISEVSVLLVRISEFGYL